MENIEAMLCAYIEGDLDAAGRAQIEKHLQDHPRHRKLIQELSAMRDLVRGLPRVKAPMEIGESLRGKVERSMLLGDTADTDQRTERGTRWPQIFAIAAIFLLCASLCLVLYKALGPTMKPAVFTEGVGPRISGIPPATDLVASSPAPTTQESSAANTPADNQQIAPGATYNLLSDSSALQRPQVLDQRKQSMMAAQFDFEAIRQRLMKSGYDIAGAKVSSPALMVVSSTDPPATNAQVAQFLNDSSGISWKKVPINAETNAMPATLPSGGGAMAGTMSANTDYKTDWARELGVTTTRPDSEVYVAKGLTPQQADALRQSLAIPQNNGAEVQVFLQPASVAATTEPSVVVAQKAANMDHLAFAAPPTTEQSEAAANSSVDLVAPPTTQPAQEATKAILPAGAGGYRTSAVANGARVIKSAEGLEDNMQVLQPADTVIVVQSTSAAAPAPQAATPPVPIVRVPQPADAAPATQPSPSTQP